MWNPGLSIPLLMLPSPFFHGGWPLDGHRMATGLSDRWLFSILSGLRPVEALTSILGHIPCSYTKNRSWQSRRTYQNLFFFLVFLIFRLFSIFPVSQGVVASRCGRMPPFTVPPLLSFCISSEKLTVWPSSTLHPTPPLPPPPHPRLWSHPL